MVEQQVKMKVQGMTCTGCEEHVVKALENAGANNVRASFRQGEVRFIVPEERKLSRFSTAVAEAGYQPEGIEILSAGNTPNLEEEGDYDLNKPIPVYILSGFLGSGKTTLLSRLIGQYTASGLRPAVLMNEFGEVNIDGTLLDENVPMKEMLNGCICCSIRGDLAQSLNDTVKEYDPDVIFVETTGIANPMEVVDAASDLLLLDKVVVRSIITIVDSVRFLDLSRRLGIKGKTIKMMRGQIQYASQVILNKTDLLSTNDLLEVEGLVKEINPKANIHQASYCRVDLQSLLLPTQLSPENTESHSHDYNHHHVMVFTHYFNQAINQIKFEAFLRQLPDEILRAKGFVEFRDVPDRFLFQFAYREPLITRYQTDTVPLVAVFIGSDLPREMLEKDLQELENGDA
jgi:G3E family GTPase/copper chaperone CopZ